MRHYQLRFNLGGPEEHIIYDNEEEAAANGITDIKIWGKVDYMTIETGDWIRSDDGYVLQVLKARQLNATSTARLVMTCNYGVTCYMLKDGTQRMPRLLALMSMPDRYSRAKVMSSHRGGRVHERKKAFVLFILAGLEPWRAVKMSMGNKSMSMNQIGNKMTEMLKDPEVIAQFGEEIQKTFGDKIAAQFPVERLQAELDDLITHSRKGSMSHMLNLKFVMQLAGYIKPVEKVKADSKELPANYENVPPPMIGS